MSHTLISFLGKVHSKNGEYQKATYKFSDKERISSFFGLALQEYLKPDRLVILGTKGSMWDVLVEYFELGDEMLEEREALISAANDDRVELAQLNTLAPLIKYKTGFDCQLKLIPYGDQPNDQVETLKVMSEGINEHDTVSLDITHSFRHLPMLVILSAFYLQLVKKVEVKGIYYGAFDMKSRHSGKVPVLQLESLLEISKWLGALHSFDKDGDYSVFADLISKEKESEFLREAAFYERTFNISEASQKLGTFSQQFTPPLPGIAELFTDALQERINWYKNPDLYQRQRSLANFYLENGDYVRASIFAMEGFITNLLQKDERSFNYNDRKNADEDYRSGNRGDQTVKKEYEKLVKIRNGMAHGNQPEDKNIRQITSKKQDLHSTLKSLIETLLPIQNKNPSCPTSTS